MYALTMTKAQVRALEPADTRYRRPVGGGVWIEVHPSGRKTARYRYCLRGRGESVTIGHYPEMDLAEIFEKRQEFARLVQQGKSPAQLVKAERQEARGSMTLREFGERYYTEVAEKKRKDPLPVKRWLERGVYPWLGPVGLTEVTAQAVQRMVYAKRDSGRPASAAAIRNVVKRVFDYAMACSLVDRNPAVVTPLRFVYAPPKRKRALSPSEIRKFLSQMETWQMARQHRLALRLILLTLVRKNDLRMARWEQIDFAAKTWEIPPEVSKSGEAHMVYLSRQALKVFAELRGIAAGAAEMVLPGQNTLTQPMAPNTLNRAMGRVKWSIPKFTVHDLRRTASTILHEMGWAPDVVETAMNHQIGGIRGVYNKAKYAKERREMLQAWADEITRMEG